MTDLKKDIPVCERCKGTGYILMVKDDKDYHGRVEKCPDCTDYLSKSRLTDEEKKLKVDDISDRRGDRTGEPMVLRFLIKRMLNDPYGFFSIVGVTGSAKSMVLCILIAEFCRQGKAARYYNASEVAEGLRAFNDKDKTSLMVYDGGPGIFERNLKDVPILAIDEIDKLLWTDYQIEKIGGIIEHRYRLPEERVTLFAMNRPPEQWQNAYKLDFILSRMQDGRFNRAWPSQVECPACLKEFVSGGEHYVPGYFKAKLPDLRPSLVRYG